MRIRRLPVFPKVDALRARVDGAAGPYGPGRQGSACDRLTPYRRVEGFRPRELYSIAALARYGALGGASINAAFSGETGQPGFRPSENHTTALRARKCIPLWWLAPPPFPRKRGHYGCLAMWPCLCRKAWKPILPPEQGEVRRSRIGGSRAAANHQNANQAI